MNCVLRLLRWLMKEILILLSAVVTVFLMVLGRYRSSELPPKAHLVCDILMWLEQPEKKHRHIC